MPKYESEEISRRHIWLYSRDIERTELLFGRTLGFSKAIRLMVRKFLNSVEAKGLIDAHHPIIADSDLQIMKEMVDGDEDIVL